MPEFYSVNVRWITTPMHPPLIDGILGLHGDWIRYNSDIWVIYTNETSKEIMEAIQKNLSIEDSIVVFPIDPTRTWGWAPSWFWEWIKARLSGAQPGTVSLPYQSKP